MESIVLPQTVDFVWASLEVGDFRFIGDVLSSTQESKESSAEGDASSALPSIGSTRRIGFKDGQLLVAKMIELSDVDRTFGWRALKSDVESVPEGAECRIALRRVTADDTTFIEWTTTLRFAAVDTTVSNIRKAVAAVLAKMKNSDECIIPPPVALVRQLSQHSQVLLQSFQDLDLNQDGRLDIKEFRVAVERMCGLGKLPEMAVNILLHEADQDSSNDVDYNEFVQFIKKREAQLQ